ncbi:MAG: rod shape-determining protein MreC [Minisyncoccota bacterium]
MKTNFLQRNRHQVSYKKRILVVVLIFVFGALFFSFSRGLMVNIFSPLWKGENAVAVGFRNLATFFKSKNSLIEENQILRDKLASSELANISLQTIGDAENSLLTNFGRVSPNKFITAAVLVHPPQTPYDSLIIDAGAVDGVSLDAEVSLPEGPKIGTVTEVFSRSSRAKLYSSNGEETNAVLERSEVPVTLVGRGGGNFEIALPRDVAVEIGDKILSANLASTVIGIVGDVEMKPTDSFKKVIVRSVANVYTLRFVVLVP